VNQEISFNHVEEMKPRDEFDGETLKYHFTTDDAQQLFHGERERLQELVDSISINNALLFG